MTGRSTQILNYYPMIKNKKRGEWEEWLWNLDWDDLDLNGRNICFTEYVIDKII